MTLAQAAPKNARRPAASRATARGVSEPPEPTAADVAPPPAPGPTRRGAGGAREGWPMRLLRGAVGFAMVVAIGGTAAWSARHYVKTSQRFAIATVMASGNKRRSADELTAAAGIVKGQNVFELDLDRARAKLLADPWIADATLARQLPGTIFVHVAEREAAGLVAVSTGETYLVTREGAVIERLEPGDPTDLPLVTGLTAQQMAFDREGAARDVRRALDLAVEYDHAPMGMPLEEVHLEPNGDLTLVVGKAAVAVRLGAPPYRRKLEQAIRVFGELDRRGAKPDTIMLDDEARADRVVVRVR